MANRLFDKSTFLLFTLFIASSFNISSDNVFKWRFDKFKKLTYNYRQIASTKSGLFENAQMKMFEKLVGNLIIKVKNDTLADVVLGDLKATMCNVDSLGDTTVVMSQSLPDIFIQNLKEDGSTKGQVNGQTEMLAIILFPITNKKMEIGDSADQPVSMPFNIFGSSINVTGYNRIKYVDKKDGIDKLETIINVSDYIIPEDVKTKYTCYMKGNSKFDFNSQKGYFTSGLVNTNMVMAAGSSDSTKDMMNLSMYMNTQIALQLIAAE
jgi:hypothetical protein